MWKFDFNTPSLVNYATTSNGDYEFCNCNTCSENEGDCDSHDDCQSNYFCGSNNCLASLGYSSQVDCCAIGKIRKLCEFYLIFLHLCYCMFIVAVNCDESGTMVAASCAKCPYEFYPYEYFYDFIYNDGTHCNGDCSWNSDLYICQMKGIF